MKEFEKLIKEYFSSFIAVIAVLVSLASVISLVEIDKNLIIQAGAALAGAGVSVIYALILIRVRQRIRERNRPRVFISYSHQDLEFVNKLKNDLEDIGVIPLIDRLELRVGDNIKQAVDRMIDRCDYVIYVSSENTKNSSWSNKEIEQAVKREKKILPVLLSDGTLPEVLNGVYYADFTETYEHGISALERTLSGNKPAHHKEPEGA